MSFTCKICGEEVEDMPLHLRSVHHMSNWDYTVLTLMGNIGEISPCFPDMTGDVITCLHKLQKNLQEDKVISYLCCIKDVYEVSQTGNIPEMAAVIHEILGTKKIKRDVYLGIGIVPGYLKEISDRNRNGIRIIPVEATISKDLVVTIGDYAIKIVPLEQCGYDMRHHNRYSILSVSNKKTTRYSKRIRLEGNICYKFWNNPGYQDTKSIFRLVDPVTNEVVDPGSVPPQTLGIIKQIILHNKTTSGILWKICNEVIRYTEVLDDQVLLRNTVKIPGKSKIKSRIMWLPVETELQNGVNLSIL